MDPIDPHTHYNKEKQNIMSSFLAALMIVPGSSEQIIGIQNS
jgi:hypothetical protein